MNDALATIVKIVLAVVLLPILIACGIIFHAHVMTFPRECGVFFMWGISGFLVLFLFLYQFWGVYDFGQKVMTGFFQFTFPVGKMIIKIIPFYLTIILVLHFVMTNLLGVSVTDHYFMFFAGFAFAMHILLTAQSTQQQEESFIKPTYLSSMVVVTILMICVTVLLFDLVFGRFTFPGFFEDALAKSVDIYKNIGGVMIGR